MSSKRTAEEDNPTGAGALKHSLRERAESRTAERNTAAVNVVLEEYRTLRQEALTSMGTQQSILSFGTAALGILLAGAFNVFNEPLPAALVFLLFVPLLSDLVFVLWMTEVVRMLRAGYFLARVERRVDELMAHEDLLSWERWAHARPSATEAPDDIRLVLRDVDRQSFEIVAAMLMSIAIGGIAIGNYEITRFDDSRMAWIAALNVVTLVFSTALAVKAHRIHESGKRLRNERDYRPPEASGARVENTSTLPSGADTTPRERDGEG